MAAYSKTPTTRILALAVLVLAAGLFLLRAYSVATKPDTPLTGSQQERELTALLEPMAGPGNVRVSLRLRAGQANEYLILLNENASVDQAKLETIISAASGYQAGADNLTILPLAFAPGTTGQLTFIEMAELGGLILLCGLLGVFTFLPREQADMMAAPKPALPVQDKETAPPARPVRLAPERSTQFATSDPQQTAQIIRTWMAKDGGHQG